jgi:hypothetical protein
MLYAAIHRASPPSRSPMNGLTSGRPCSSADHLACSVALHANARRFTLPARSQKSRDPAPHREASADCHFPHRASPLVSPKPAENRRLPLPFKIQSLSPPGSGSLHFSALCNRARPLPVRWLLALRFVPRRRIRWTQAAISLFQQENEVLVCPFI